MVAASLHVCEEDFDNISNIFPKTIRLSAEHWFLYVITGPGFSLVSYHECDRNTEVIIYLLIKIKSNMHSHWLINLLKYFCHLNFLKFTPKNITWMIEFCDMTATSTKCRQIWNHSLCTPVSANLIKVTVLLWFCEVEFFFFLRTCSSK